MGVLSTPLDHSLETTHPGDPPSSKQSLKQGRVFTERIRSFLYCSDRLRSWTPKQMEIVGNSLFEKEAFS